MFNSYFDDHARFTSIPKGKLHVKFTTLDIKLHGTKIPHYHVRNFLSAMTLKGIYNAIFHIIFPQTFDKDVITCYSTVDRQKVTRWKNLHKEFVHQ